MKRQSDSFFADLILSYWVHSGVIVWLDSTKTAVVSMSSAVGSATRSFIDGVNGTHIKNDRMYVRQSALREAFDRIVQEPGAIVNPNRDAAVIAGTIVAGVKGPAVVEAAGKFIALICAKYGAGAAGAAIFTQQMLLDAMRNISTQTINKILLTKHAWHLVVPKVDWANVQRFVQQTIQHGQTRLMQVRSGERMVYEAVRTFGDQVVVVHYSIINGVMQISDAWVRTK